MLYHAEVEIESDMEQEEFNAWLIDALRNISIIPLNTNVKSVYCGKKEYVPTYVKTQ
jgi:hypothetical protein